MKTKLLFFAAAFLLLVFLVLRWNHGTVSENILQQVNLKEAILKSQRMIHYEGEFFYAYKWLGSKKMLYSAEIYLWVLGENYTVKNGKAEIGSGFSIPMKVIIRNPEGQPTIKRIDFPGDGSEYSGDIKKMLPLLVEQKVFTIGNEDIDDLQAEIEKQVEEYVKNKEK
jgi:hypothetical protein